MINVAAGIIENNGRVLLCQRKSTARYALKWEFPGGKVEEGESPEEGLRRELQEELGIQTEMVERYHRQHYTYADSGTFDVLYYRVLRHTGVIVNHVFESYAWVPVPELGAYDILEGNRDVVDMLMGEYESVRSPEA